MKIAVVILAAGKGKRMVSNIPKVLHKIGGMSMLEHVIKSVENLKALTANEKTSISTCVVLGHGSEHVGQAIKNHEVKVCYQTKMLGTGHALAQSYSLCKDTDIVIVLYGDVPLIEPHTLLKLIDKCKADTLALLTVHMDSPHGYGRIIRDKHNNIVTIVEEADASTEQKEITEVNTGIMAIPGKYAWNWLSALKNDNKQQEYYLTDIVKMSVDQKISVKNLMPRTVIEVQGINNRSQLAIVERAYQTKMTEKYMAQGVTFLDPSRVDIRGQLEVGKDITIDINCVFEGVVVVGNNVSIGAGCIIRNSKINDNTSIEPYSIIDQSSIESNCMVGPFARLRPNTKIGVACRVGNFVELKNTTVNDKSKINHLSYIGDASLGEHVNIGAGTITCNFDGANKHQTVIKNKAFIGSNNSLIAPVTIGEMSTTGAGSTITDDVANGKLAITRSKQKILSNWKRPEKIED